MVKLYRLLSEAIDWPADDPRIVEIADILERLMIRAVEAGEVGTDPFDDPFVDLLDATAVEASPVAERLLEILRGARLEGLDPHRASACRQTQLMSTRGAGPAIGRSAACPTRTASLATREPPR